MIIAHPDLQQRGVAVRSQAVVVLNAVVVVAVVVVVVVGNAFLAGFGVSLGQFLPLFLLFPPTPAKYVLTIFPHFDFVPTLGSISPMFSLSKDIRICIKDERLVIGIGHNGEFDRLL